MARNRIGQRHESITESLPAPTPPRARIDTQIHRRSKGKAVLPLEAEWQVGAAPPPELKLSTKMMDKQRNAGQ
jgi:hypothetical protein